MTEGTLKLKQIIKHRNLQVREQLDMNRVEFLEEVYEAWVPLLVFKVGDKFYLSDGYHRITAAERLSLETVRAEIREGTFEDVLLARRKGAKQKTLQARKEHNRKLRELDFRFAGRLVACSQFVTISIEIYCINRAGKPDWVFIISMLPRVNILDK